MRRLVQAVAVLTIVLFLPFQAMAGVCFNVFGFPSPVEMDVDLYAISAFQALFFSIGGALLGWCGPGTPPAPFTGTAWLDPFTGALAIAITIMAIRASCAPGILEGVLEPGLFFGTATAVNLLTLAAFTLTLQHLAVCSQLQAS